MLYRSSIIGVLIGVCTIVLANEARVSIEPDVRCLRTCFLQFRCSPYYHPSNEVVYAIEDGVCRVFANGCIFSSYNCQRQNACLKVLKSVPKEKCIELCPICEKEERKPVCATFLPDDARSDSIIKAKKQYINKCEADREACLTGIPYAFIEEGYCLSLVSEIEG